MLVWKISYNSRFLDLSYNLSKMIILSSACDPSNHSRKDPMLNCFVLSGLPRRFLNFANGFNPTNRKKEEREVVI